MMRKLRLLDRLSALLMLVGSIACAPGPTHEAGPVGDPVRTGYRASGNEPFWSLVFEEATMDFSQLGAEHTISAPRPQAERVEGGWRYASTADGGFFVVEIENRRCNDSMSGRPFPHTVVVTVMDQVYTGCGGDTGSLLVGEEWRVTWLEGSETIDPAPTLLFEPDVALSGSGGCNRYRATYEITGEGIVIGPAAATRMACAEQGVNAQETRFFAALERVTRFDLTEDGSLELLVLDEPIIVARR